MEKFRELFDKLPKTLRETLAFIIFIIFILNLRIFVASLGLEGTLWFLYISGALIYWLFNVGRDYFYDYEYRKYIPEDDKFIYKKKRKKEDRDKFVLKKIVLISISVIFLVPTNLKAFNDHQTQRYESRRAYEEQQFINSLPSNTTTVPQSSTTTVPLTLSWDNMYEVCTHHDNIMYDSYSLRGLGLNRFENPLFFYIEENPEKVLEFCNNNYSYNPISPQLYIYSAKWLDEALNLNRWIEITKKVCERYPIECEGYGSEYNWDFDFLTLQTAFEIKNNDDTYNCLIEKSFPNSSNLETNRYVRFTDASSSKNYDNEGNRIDIPIGNQYIRSSIIFPKPYDEFSYDNDDSEYGSYSFSPEQNFDLPSLTQEPLYLWNCFSQSGDPEGPLIIRGFGPPFIRGNINVDNTNISAEGKWVMWSVFEPGPNSVVVELEITKFYWFDNVPTTIEFCNNYKISDEYLSAEISSNREYFPFPEIINLEFATSHFCYLRTELVPPTYYP